MQRKMMWAVVISGAMVWIGAFSRNVMATPASGFVGTTLAVGRFGDIDVSNISLPDNLWGNWKKKVWLSLQKTKGPSDLYESDDPTCTPHVYTQGMGFVDPGGDHVHLLRNEDSVEATTIAVPARPGRRDPPDRRCRSGHLPLLIGRIAISPAALNRW
jgi:hypothetical protein